MDIFEVRRQRLRKIIEELFGGNVAAFAQNFDFSRAQVHQFISPNYNAGRSIGERAARNIESKIGYPAYWLDRPSVDMVVPEPTKAWSMENAGQLVKDLGSGSDQPSLGAKTLHIKAVATTGPDGGLKIEPAPPSVASQALPVALSDGEGYAVLIKGNDLRPRIRNGECIIVAPSRPALPGDDVLIKDAAGEYSIQRFLFRRGDYLTFTEIVEGRSITGVIESDIIAMWVVIGTVAPLDDRQPEEKLETS